MLIQLPQSEKYNRVRVVVKSHLGEQSMILGEPHKTVEVDVPADGEVTGQYLDNGSRLVGDPVVLVKPKEQPEPEVKDEEAPEEPREEDVHELVAGTPEPVQDVVEDAPEPAVEQVQEVKKKPRRRQPR